MMDPKERTPDEFIVDFKKSVLLKTCIDKIQRIFHVQIILGSIALREDANSVEGSKFQWIKLEGESGDRRSAKEYIVALCNPDETTTMGYPEYLTADLVNMEAIESQNKAVIEHLGDNKLKIAGTSLAITMAMSAIEDIIRRYDDIFSLDCTDGAVQSSSSEIVTARQSPSDASRRLNQTFVDSYSQFSDEKCRPEYCDKISGSIKRSMIDCMQAERHLNGMSPDARSPRNAIDIPLPSQLVLSGNVETDAWSPSSLTGISVTPSTENEEILRIYAKSLNFSDKQIDDELKKLPGDCKPYEFIDRLRKLGTVRCSEDEPDCMIISDSPVVSVSVPCNKDKRKSPITWDSPDTRSELMLSNDNHVRDSPDIIFLDACSLDTDDNKMRVKKKKTEEDCAPKRREFMRHDFTPTSPSSELFDPDETQVLKVWQKPSLPSTSKLNSREGRFNPISETPKNAWIATQESNTTVIHKPKPVNIQQLPRLMDMDSTEEDVVIIDECQGHRDEGQIVDDGFRFGNHVKINSKVPVNTKKHIDRLRYIVIDGSNVAMTHGNNTVFSCRGIQICVNYFLERGHQVVAFVPHWRVRRRETHRYPIANQEILTQMQSMGVIAFTPSREIDGRMMACHDDRFILDLAEKEDGVIVSNDQFRDLMREKVTWKKLVSERLLMYTFVQDNFMVPEDPFGRNGIKLGELLTKPELRIARQSGNIGQRIPPQMHRPLSVRHGYSNAVSERPLLHHRGGPGLMRMPVFQNQRGTVTMQRPMFQHTAPLRRFMQPNSNIRHNFPGNVHTTSAQGQSNIKDDAMQNKMVKRSLEKTSELYKQLKVLCPNEEHDSVIRNVLENHDGETDINRLSNYCLTVMFKD